MPYIVGSVANNQFIKIDPLVQKHNQNLPMQNITLYNMLGRLKMVNVEKIWRKI